jgi:ABC-type lipoprotein release transport system permease subunit
MELFKIAWRNIWRNKKRTFITVSSVFFALLLALIMRGLQIGTYGHMVKNSVEYYGGYVQIHKEGYQNNQILDNAFFPNDSIRNLITSTENVKDLLPRISAFALASAEDKTKGALIVGLDAERDNKLTKVKDRLISGRMPMHGENSVVLAEKLAEYLELGIGDTAVFIGQGYHGFSAAGLYSVVGIISYPVPQLNNSLAYLDINTAQEFLSIGEGLNAWVVVLNDNNLSKETGQNLQKILPEGYEALDWEIMQPEVKQGIESDNAGGLIILMILYVIIGFGIFGTVLMMIAERRKEFSIMISVGMQKTKLAKLVTLETMFVVLLGIVSALVIAIPFIYYLHLNPLTFTGPSAEIFVQYGMEPIVPVAWETSYFYGQILVVFILSIIAIAYPILSLLKLDVTKANR